MRFTVYSGGQSGVDQAAWRAAKALVIPTGGWMPIDFMTEDGPRPQFAAEYGAKQWAELGLTTAEAYRVRTKANVRAANVTLWVGETKSRGCLCTYRAFREKSGEAGRDPGVFYARQGWIAVPRRMRASGWRDEAAVASMIGKMPHDIVNVAGNRESSDPGIGAWAEGYLSNLFRLLLEAP